MVTRNVLIKKRSHVLQTGGDRVFGVFNGVFIVFVTVITLYPLIYVLSASISSPSAVVSGRMWLWPVDVTWEGYSRIMQNQEIWLGYKNTIVYVLVQIGISLLTTLPAAYALTIKPLPGRKILVFLFSVTMFFSGGMIPLYVICRNLNIVNTMWAVILPSATSMWYIILTRTFYQSTIPRELEEASQIDGCSPFGTFLRVVMPLSGAIIAVMALFFGVARWNSYFGEMIFFRDRQLYSLQLFLREILIIAQFSEENTSNADAITMAEQLRISSIIKYATMIVATIPLIAAYPFIQRYFVKGVLIGSIKG